VVESDVERPRGGARVTRAKKGAERPALDDPRILALDPQTSGGLLIAVSPNVCSPCSRA
jgi:selenophosphate synthase